MTIDEIQGRIEFAGQWFAEGEWITLDCNASHIHAGKAHIVPVIPQALIARLDQLHGQAPSYPPGA